MKKCFVQQSLRFGAIVLVPLILLSCSYYSISKEDFVRQAAQAQSQESGQAFVYVYPYMFAKKYEANNLKKVLCKDKSGKLVYLIPDQNTQWEFVRNDGTSVRMYFNTMLLSDSTVSGLRSRILSVPNRVTLSDVKEIKIYAEFPKTEPYKAN